MKRVKTYTLQDPPPPLSAYLKKEIQGIKMAQGYSNKIQKVFHLWVQIQGR